MNEICVPSVNNSIDPVTGLILNATLVWDNDLLDWVKMTQPGGEGGGLTDEELRATPVPVSGTFFQVTQPVSIASMPSTPVTGTFYQATQPVSLATAPTTPVTGTFWQATQPVSGPLTDAQLRNTAVPVSGPLTDAQVRATPLPVNGTITDGGAGKTLKRAIVAATQTDDVIALVAGKKLKVYQYALQSRADNMTAQFRDGAAGSLLGLRWGINTREGATSAPVTPPTFLFATSAGNSLQVILSGTGTVDIEVSYWDDDAT